MQRKLLALLILFIMASLVFADQTNCISEGGVVLPDAPFYQVCCEGLSKIASTAVNIDNDVVSGVSQYICSKCGNLVCEQWETTQSCSSDCLVPTLYDDSNQTTDINQTTPVVCTLEWAPVCGVIKSCATNLTNGNTTCSENKKTFGNKCQANAEQAQILYAGECGQETNPVQPMPPVCQTIIGFDVSLECQTDENNLAYQKSTWSCGNGKVFYEGGLDSCKTKDTWMNYAKEYCAKECNITIPEGQMCGGIAGIQCPNGYACKLDGAYPDASGKCFPTGATDCPIYSPPYCPNGKIISKVDERGCSRPYCDTIVPPQIDSYKSAYFRCSNGKEYKESSDVCMPYTAWKEKARNVCAALSTKCASTTSTSGGGSAATGNFLLEMATAVTNVVAPASTTTNPIAIDTKCIGGNVELIDLQVYDQCTGQDNECRTYEDEKGCISVKCVNGEMTTSCPTTTCLAQDMEKIRAIKQNCENEKGQVIVKNTSAGCMEYICMKNTADLNLISTCITQDQIPQEKYATCERVGGKLLTNFSENGCLSFIDCAGATKISDANVTINKKIISDQTALLGLALKLETLRIDIQKTAAKTQGIADYYTEIGDTNSATKFQLATDLLNQAIAKIDTLKALIKDNVENFTEEQALTVKTTIKEIREVILKQVLMSMLG